MKHCFNNDYNSICHPKVFEYIRNHLGHLYDGYSLDLMSYDAIRTIKDEMNYQNCDIHFLAGGTITNVVAISAFLKPYEAVISVKSAHINIHETGAIEHAGYKILNCESFNGKVVLESVLDIVNQHVDEHMVKPRLLYLSNSTEFGTIYTKSELTAISKFCKDYNLLLFIDGARLFQALGCAENDLTLEDICLLTDAFYIGGNKIGAFIGECLVVVNDSLKENMRYSIKQKGAMVSKGFFISANFKALFTNKLCYEIGKYECDIAKYLHEELEELGFDFIIETITNQVFVILSKPLVELLKTKYQFSIWQEFDKDNYVVRFVTSFETTKDDVVELIKIIRDNIDL